MAVSPDPAALGLQPAVKDVVFAHIPKTAGTSLRNILVAARPDATQIFDYGDNTAKIGGAFADEERTPDNILAIRHKLPRDQRVFVCGHFPVGRYLGVFHPASFITLLRQPVSRIISAYRYYSSHLGYKGSLAEFVEEPQHINRQSKLLWGIDLRDIGFIGLTESMPDMLAALSRHLGVELRNRQDNVAKGGAPPDIEPRLRERIEALNADDLRLYRHVAANLDYFTNYRGRKDARLTLAKGKVSVTANGMFRGWATASHAGQLVEIEVRLGDQVIHRCYADQFVANLEKSKQVTHPVRGFSVQVPRRMLAGHSQVRFVIAGTESDLDGSPVAL